MKKILTLVLCAVILAVGVNAAFEKVNTYSNNFSEMFVLLFKASFLS